MQIQTEFPGIPRNSGYFYCKKYRGIPYVFQKIPSSAGSQKRTSVDTLARAPKCGGGGGVAGSQPMSTAVHMGPK
jgi:hypothetical protein